jgi:nucleoid-associated protein YgaU
MKHARNGGPDVAFRLGRRLITAVADDMSTVQRVVAGVVAALVGISPFGAWNEVEAQADPIEAGTQVEVGPFEVTIVKAATADELAHLVPAPGNHLLAVVADVTNTGEVPEYTTTFAQAIPAPKDAGIIPQVPIEDLLGAEPSPAPSASADPEEPAEPEEPEESGEPEEPKLPIATVFNVEDGTEFTFLNPDVSYRVALVWEQSGEYSEKTVPLEMVELEWVEDDPQGLDDGHWFPNEVIFQGQIPLNAGKPAADAEAAQQ